MIEATAGSGKTQLALALMRQAHVAQQRCAYVCFNRALADHGVTAVDAIAFDIGVSSMQLDEAERGFAYSVDAPLDMRMDATSGITAADVLNTYSVEDLTRVLRDYGDERYARRIAERIVAERPWTTSARLVEVVRESIPMKVQRTSPGNPAKRTFQALRIEVNDELGVLERAIPAALDCLAVGGRMVVMSYQSLEDKIVKQAFTAGASDSAPHGLPVVPESMKPWLRLITRGAEKASEAEISSNPRSQSVRVRAVERVAA